MSREVRRVPLDFDWPLKQVWEGYLMPDRFHERPCQVCVQPVGPFGAMFGNEPVGDGLTPSARAIANTFYPHEIPGDDRAAQERLAWHDKIGQAEVENLVKRHRLHGFNLWDRVQLPEPWEMRGEGDDAYPVRFDFVRNDTPTPTAAEVNAQQHMRGLCGHDGINRMILIQYRCEVLGIDMDCEACAGHGSVESYDGQRAEAEAWTAEVPPTGDGWQLWETVSEGSPVSPVFSTADELAQWLTTDEGGRASGPSRTPMTISQARAFVGIGWAPTGFIDAGGVHDGAEYVGTAEVLKGLDGSA